MALLIDFASLVWSVERGVDCEAVVRFAERRGRKVVCVWPAGRCS